MFFDDIAGPKTKRVSLAELPRTPETNWRPPTSYPNWQYATAIGFDFEVKENDFDHGPGWARGQASICGGSLDLLFPDGSTWTEYRPIRHEVEPQYNLPVDSTVRFWRDVLQSDIPKFGANLIYDIGNATDEKIFVKGALYDCQFAEALLSQDDPVALEWCAEKYLGESKETSVLYEWCAKAYGGEPTPSQRSNIFRASPRLAGPYGEQDARLPRLIVIKQMKELHLQGLWNLFRMECELIPLWVRMRLDGCRVDLDKAARMKVELQKQITIKERAIYDLVGRWINVNSSKELAPAYDAVNVKYPWTAGKCQSEYHAHTKECGGQPSFVADWLRDQNDPLSELILETRQLYKLKDTFIQSYILDAHVNGKIHGQFHPLRNEGSRGETGGTGTGRLSSSTPDLQNIPSRTKLGVEIMKCFLPDAGDICFENGDQSQVEYRAFMDVAVSKDAFGNDTKADEFREMYRRDKKTDYHNLAQNAIKDATGIYIPRSAKEVAASPKPLPTGRMTIKEANFAKLFGVGAPKMSKMAHCALTEGQKILKALGTALPFIEPSQKAFIREAKELGYITTKLGRRYRFDKWEAVSEWDEEAQAYKRTLALPYHAAIREYGRVQRAGTHKAMAVRCQGTGTGDVMKKALHDALRCGLFDFMGYPKLTVHDSVGRSVKDLSPEQEQASQYYYWLMENALPLRVPLLFEVSRGANWGSCE